MGKKNFAMSASASDQVTAATRYGNDLAVWVRGWDHGIEIIAQKQEGKEVFEVYATGGSLAKSNGQRLLAVITDGEWSLVFDHLK